MNMPSEFNDTRSPLALLKTRKSASAKALSEPGSTPQQLREILAIAVRVPDHGKLTPWRFVLFEGEARAGFGKALRKRWAALHPDHGEEMLAFHERLFQRAPVVLGVVSRAAPHPKIPEWEQTLSSAAVCQNILIAAAALGVGAQWQTDWPAYDAEMRAIIGLAPHERIAGFIYLGTPAAAYEERPRPDPVSLLTRWGA
ncbi:nitroreductase [soil metagenome]